MGTRRKLQKHGGDWQLKVLERFDRLIKKYGLLHLLKKGLSVDDAHLTLIYPAPLASSSDKVKQNFNANLFSSTRQVRYSMANMLEEIDLVLFINGLPFATLELKNPWTGQTARYHGQKQYREDRDIVQPLLQFGRCLVHMAVDTDEVYMITRLDGKNTFFCRSIRAITTAQVIPQIRTAIKPPTCGKRYSARPASPISSSISSGSGKSNSITWAAYQLIEVYPANLEIPGAIPETAPGVSGIHSVPGDKSLDQPLFDSVIVVTDRRLLDKQLRENIRDFSEVKNIIAPAFKSSELKSALEQGKKIIITTIQKFPFIIDGIADLSDKRFAVIIDEAHRSQSGAHDNMNRAMGKNENGEEEGLDVQDKILQAIQSRKMRGNASYLAFTATPKNTTLEKFGCKQQDGSFEPFDLYSMKQAIEEGFILSIFSIRWRTSKPLSILSIPRPVYRTRPMSTCCTS